MMLKKVLRSFSALTLVTILIFAWEAYSRYILPGYDPMAKIMLPPPSAAISDLWILIKNGMIFNHIGASAYRVFGGFFLAAIVGIPLGLAMGLWKPIREQMEPIVDLLRPIPPVAWIPVAILWLGVSDSQQIFIIFIGAIFPILLNTIAGVLDLDPILKRAALMLGSNKKTLFLVMFKGALPSIFLGIRISLGFAWFVIVAAELVSAPDGLGFLILEGRNAIKTERIYVGMFAIGIIAYLQNLILLHIQSKLIPWK